MNSLPLFLSVLLASFISQKSISQSTILKKDNSLSNLELSSNERKLNQIIKYQERVIGNPSDIFLDNKNSNLSKTRGVGAYIKSRKSKNSFFKSIEFLLSDKLIQNPMEVKITIYAVPKNLKIKCQHMYNTHLFENYISQSLTLDGKPGWNIFNFQENGLDIPIPKTDYLVLIQSLDNMKEVSSDKRNNNPLTDFPIKYYLNPQRFLSSISSSQFPKMPHESFYYFTCRRNEIGKIPAIVVRYLSPQKIR